MTDQNNGPAPLTAEVAQIIGALKDRQASWVNDGSSPDKLCHDAADMLTTLATQLAERDAQLARVTAYLFETEALEMQHGAVIERLSARIAALTEALQRQNTAAEGLLAAEARKSPVGFYLSKLGVEVLNARAALTTNKEPKI